MQETSGVLFQMHACDANSSSGTIRPEFDPALRRNWQIVLRNLIALRQIGIDVVLAIEFIERWDRAVERQSSHDRLADSCAVDDWQHPRKPQANRAGMGIGGGAGVV